MSEHQTIEPPLEFREDPRKEIAFAVFDRETSIAGLEVHCLGLLNDDRQGPLFVAAMLARLDRWMHNDDNNEEIVNVLARWVLGRLSTSGGDVPAVPDSGPEAAVAAAIPQMVGRIDDAAWENEPERLGHELLRLAQDTFPEYSRGGRPDSGTPEETVRRVARVIVHAIRDDRWSRELIDDLLQLQTLPGYEWLEGFELARLGVVSLAAVRKSRRVASAPGEGRPSELPAKVAAGGGGQVSVAAWRVRGGPEGFVLEARPDQSPTIEVSAPGTKAVIAEGLLEGVEIELDLQGVVLWLRGVPSAIHPGRLALHVGGAPHTPARQGTGTFRFDLSALRADREPVALELIYQVD